MINNPNTGIIRLHCPSCGTKGMEVDAGVINSDAPVQCPICMKCMWVVRRVDRVVFVIPSSRSAELAASTLRAERSQLVAELGKILPAEKTEWN